MKSKQTSSFKLCRRILLEARPCWPHLGLIFFFNFLGTPLGLLAPFPLKIALDNVLGTQPVPAFSKAVLPLEWIDSHSTLLLLACLATLAILTLQALQGFACWVYQLYVGEKLVLSARAHIFEHVQKLSLQHHDEQGSPDQFYRLQNDVSRMHDLINYGIIPFVNSIILFVSLFAVTYRLDHQISLLALVTLPLLTLFSRFYSRRSRSRWADAKETEKRSVGVIQEVLGQIRVVKAFGMESRETDRFRLYAGQHTKTYLRAVGNEATFCLIAAVCIAIVSALALWVGVRHVQSGTLTVGDFIVLMAYFAQLFKPVEVLSKLVASIQTSLASAERAFALLDEVPSIRNREDSVSIKKARGAIEFHSVSFAYRPDQICLDQISFRIEAGQRVAIIGPTGSGKTTLTHLLVRFLDPEQGRVTLDGQDLRDLNLNDLRKQFGIVLQDSVLFSGTIADNIAYGNSGASPEAIETAARDAEAHDFILRLPDGYATQVGERGLSLSGGERQRISLARALLLDAPILLLDEPTSSMDSDREEKIVASLERVQRGRTIITVSHRPAVIEKYDLILKIDGGKLSQIHPRL